MSFDVILPFLRPIAHLLQDTTVTEMMVNPSRRVFVEREGLVEEVPDVAVDERNLRLSFPTARRRNGRS